MVLYLFSTVEVNIIIFFFTYTFRISPYMLCKVTFRTSSVHVLIRGARGFCIYKQRKSCWRVSARKGNINLIIT